MRKRKGFTLIELMIVIAIIAILAAILVPNFLRARNQGQLTACKSNLKNMGTALEMYSTDYSGIYPAATASLTVSGTYLQTLPTCPLASGAAYGYTRGSSSNSYTVSCISTFHNGVGGCTASGQPSYDSLQGLLPR